MRSTFWDVVKRWFGKRRKSSRCKNSALTTRLDLQPLEERRLMAIRVWTGLGADTNWSTAANWSASIKPVVGDDLVFPAGPVQTNSNNDLAAGTRINTLRIGGSGYNITGNNISLYGGLTANYTTGSSSVANSITLVNAQTFVVANSAASLTLSGTVDTANLIGTTNLLGTATITGLGTSALTIDGSGTLIEAPGGVIAGDGSITKLGDGTAFFQGTNSFTGVVDIRQGIVKISNSAALGNTDGFTQVTSGASLQLQGSINVNEPLSIRDGGIGFGSGNSPSGMGALNSLAGSNAWNGGIELASTAAISVESGTLDVGGVISAPISQTRNLVKLGGGTLRLSGAQPNLFTGTTTVISGTLQLNKSPGVNAIPGSLVIGDIISGDNNATVQWLNHHQLPETDFYSTSQLAVSVNPSGVLDLNGFTDAIGLLNMSTGPTFSADVQTGSTGQMILTGTVSVNNSVTAGSSGVSPAATITGNVDLGTLYSGVGGATQARQFIVGDSQTPDIAADLVISANVTGGNIQLEKIGVGTMRLSGSNTYTGATVLSGGFLELGGNSALGTGLLSIQGASNPGLIAVGGNVTLQNNVSLDGNVTLLGSNDLTFSGSTTMTGNTNHIINVMNPNQQLVLAGGLKQWALGTSNLVKGGRGTLTLGGQNATGQSNYQGTTTINADGGTLRLVGSSGTLLNTPSITVGPNATLWLDNSQAIVADRLQDFTSLTLSGGALKLSGNASGSVSESVGAVAVSNDINATITADSLLGATLILNTLTLGNVGSTVNFVGSQAALSMTGTNRIIVANSPPAAVNGVYPQFTVTGPNTFDLATIGANSIGAAIVPLPANDYVTDISQAGPLSNVRISSNQNVTISRVVNSLLIDPGVTLGGTGTVTVATGQIAFASLNQSNVTSSIAGPNLVLGAAGRITVQAGETATISSQLMGIGQAFYKQGGGTLVLRGDNQLTAGIFLNQGVLNVQSSTALGAAAGGGAALSLTTRHNTSLELQQTDLGPVNIDTKILNLQGTGLNDSGVLRNVAGNNTWLGNVVLGGDIIDLTGTLAGLPQYTTPTTFITTASGSQLNLFGIISGAPDLVKMGTGTLAYTGIQPNTNTGTTRVLAGTLLLSKLQGLNAINTPLVIGIDSGSTPAEVRLANSDQILDTALVEVRSTGKLNLAGFSDMIGNVNLVIGASGAGIIDIGSGGWLTLNGNVTVFARGMGNPTGAGILNGTLALQQYQTAAAVTRTYNVNDGASGDDLLITSSIVDGSGLSTTAVTKTGFGNMVYGGSGSNTYIGLTTVNQGELDLAKSGGTAFMGSLVIGDQVAIEGYAKSDIVRLRAPNQLPDALATLVIHNTGWLDMNGFSDTFGTADGSTAITLNSGVLSINSSGSSGTLTLIGDVTSTAVQNSSLFNVQTPPRIEGGSLSLGTVTRSITSVDNVGLPYDLIISTNISGGGGINKLGTGLMLLTGDSNYSGPTFFGNGHLAVGSNSALGTGLLYVVGGNNVIQAIEGYNGARTITNNAFFNVFSGTGSLIFVGGNQIGGGGNDLTFSGAINLTGAAAFNVPFAGAVDFTGGVGELYASQTLSKTGFGTVFVSSAYTPSGTITIQQNGGTLSLRDAGTAVNVGSIVVNLGGTLELDNNTGANITNRLVDNLSLTLSGGNFAFSAKPGAVSAETIGPLVLTASTSSMIQTLASTTPGSLSTLTYGNLTRNAASTIIFAGRGADIGGTTASNQIAYTVAPALTTSGVFQFGALYNSNGFEFMTASSGFLIPQTSQSTLTGSSNTTNVKLTSNTILSTTATMGGLLVSGNPTITLGGSLLAPTAGPFLLSGTPTINSPGGLVLPADSVIITDPFVTTNATIAGDISGPTTNLTFGGRGTVALSGNNTFTAPLMINDGAVVVARSTTAIGAAGSNVNVNYGGRLDLDLGAGSFPMVNRPLALIGQGEGNTAAVPLRVVSGDITWLGTVSMLSNRTAMRQEAGSRLIISGVVSGAAGFNKLGPGALQFGGASNNTFSAQSNVWEGAVELNKIGGANAIAAGAPLLVGDFLSGTSGTDSIVWLQSFQMGNATAGNGTITLNGNALLDVRGFTEDFAQGAGNSIVMNVGPAASPVLRSSGGGTVMLGALTAGAGNVAVAAIAGGAPSAASIQGVLTLNDVASAGTRAMLVTDTAALNDLVISAVVANSTAGSTNLVFGAGALGTGRSVLAADSPLYTGTIAATAGELAITSSNALGATGAATIIGSLGAMLLQGTFSSFEPLVIAGAGIVNSGALRSVSGNNALLGSVTMTSASTIGVHAGADLSIGGAITGNFTLTKNLGGGLELNGTTANTLTGLTLLEGALRLNKSGGGTIMTTASGTLTVGNDAGGAGADLLVSMAPNQFPAANTMNISSSGRWELKGNNESITGLLNMTAGPMNSAQITSTTGTPTLTFSTALNAVAIGTTTTTSPGTLLASGLSLDLGSATRNFSVADSLLHLRELQIDSNIIAASSGGINKTLGGTFFVSQANPFYTGNTTINAGTLAVGNNNSLGTAAATLIVNGAGNLMPMGGPVTLSQNLTLSNNLTIFGTDNLTLSGPIVQLGAGRSIFFSQAGALVTLGNSIELNNFAMTVAPGGFNVVSQISAAIQDSGGSGSLVKNGLGTLLLSSNSSSYPGATTINAGIVRISANNALGTAVGSTSIAAGASLFVDPGIGGALTINEPISLTGPATGFQVPMGALRNLTGSNTLGGTITLATATQNYVLGAETGSTMVLTGAIASSVATANVVKAGGGTIELQGGAVNSISGSVTVREGTLRFNKSGGVGFGTTALIVGDDAGIDRLEIIGANQFTASPAITMQSSGVLDASLATGTTSVGTLNLTRGLATSSTVLIGSVAALNLTANVNLLQFGNSNDNSPAALIGGSTTGILNSPASRVITVADSVAIGSAEDLTIAVPMTGVTPSKAGFGTLGLTAPNSFVGAFTISQGFYTAGTTLFGGGVVLRGNGTLNSAASGNGNNVVLSTGGSLIIDNSGTVVLDRVNNTATITSSGGTIGFIVNSTFGGSEQVGPVVISGNADTTIRYVTAGVNSDFTLQSLTRNAAGTATVKFVGVNNDIGIGNKNLTITTTPLTTGSGAVTPIIPFATIQGPSGFDLVADQSVSAGFQVGALPNVGSYDDPDTTPNGNLKFSSVSSPSISSDYTANALIFEGSGLTAGQAGINLAVAPASGPALIANSGTGNTIAANLSFFTEAQMFIDSGDLTIQAVSGGNQVTNKNGAGTLSIAGASTLTGPYNINNGLVTTGTNGALGGTGAVTIGFGASLELQGGFTSPVNKALTINGVGLNNNSTGALRSSGTNTWVGNVTLNSPLTAINVLGGSLAITGSVAGTATTMVKYGPGTLDYSGNLANTFAGTTVVNEGTISLNRSLVAIAGPLVIGDSSGTDTVIYGSNTQTAIQTGAAIATSAALSLSNGGVLNLNGRTDYFNTITMTGGSVGGGTINLLTSIVYNPGLQGRISGNIAAGINPTATRSISVLDGPFLNDLVIDASLVGSFPINKIGGFTNDSALLLSGNNVGYNGMINVQAGTLAIGNDSALGNSSVAFVPSTTAVIVRAEGGTRSINNPIILASTGNRLVLGGPNNPAGNDIVFGGNVYIPGATPTAILQVDPTIQATISGAIGDFSVGVPSGLNKSGMGTLVLSGPNTYTGNTLVTQGVLRVTNSAALGGTLNEQQVVNPTAASFTLTLNGSTTASFNTASATIVQDIQNGLNSLATIGGVFGSATVSASGAGFLVTFGGSLAGTSLPLMASNNANLVQIYDGTNTQVTGGAVLELVGVNLPNETLAAISAGFGYNNSTGRPESYTGIIRAVAGTTNTVGSGSTPIGLTAAANNYFGVDAGASLVINGVVTGVTAPTGITIKTGTGTLELAGNAPNLSTGVTQVLDGTLRLNKAAGLTAIAGTTLTIGDNVGASNTDVLQLMASEQIADTTVVNLSNTGRILGDSIYAARTTAEVQQITNTANAGFYRLAFDGFSTSDLAFNSAPAAVQVALNRLPSIASNGGVLVSGAANNYTMAFLSTSNQPQIKVLSGTSAAFAGGTVMTTTLVEGGQSGRETLGALNIAVGPVAAGNVLMDSASTLLLTGNLAVSNVGGQLTNSPGATISVGTLALAQATNIASGARTITVADTTDGNDLTIAANVVDGSGVQVAISKLGAGRLTLQSNAALPFSGLIAHGAGVLNINSTAGLGAQGLNEVQTLTLGNMTGSASGGTFTLSIGAETSGPLAYNAGADEIRSALGSFTSVGGISNVNVLSTVNATNVVYTIVISNRGNLPTMSVSPATLSGGITTSVAANFDGGTATNGVTVVAGAALELQGTINSSTKPFTLSGSGILNSGGFFINNASGIMGSGSLRVLGGNHTIGGTMTLLAGPLNLAIESGSMNLTGLTNFFGVANTIHTKTGTGTLELSGTVANVATAAISLYDLDGTIVLNKTNNVQSLPNNITLYIGDAIGNDDSDVVRYGTGSSGAVDQIGTGNIFVQSTGRLDMNGRSDSVGGAILTSIGPQGGGDIVGVNGLLSLASNISTLVHGGPIASSTTSMITTNLALVASRNITVMEGAANDELTISGSISGLGLGITKLGLGTLTLANSNLFTGATNINLGTVIVQSNAALGSAAGATNVLSGATLAMRGNINYGVPEVINLGGTGSQATGNAIYSGAFVNLSGNNSFSGTITQTAASTLISSSGSLAINGSIDAGNFPMTIRGAGNLTFNSSSQLYGQNQLIKGLDSTDTGTLTFNTDTTYDGPVTLNAGTTLVNNNLTGLGTWNVNGTATLGGSGNLAEPIFSSLGAGILSPGNNTVTGILSTGNVNLGSSASLAMFINGTTAGTSYDQLNVTGSVNLNNTTLNITRGAFNFSPGTQLTLIDNDGSDSIVGNFLGATEGQIFTTSGGVRGAISYVGGTGNDVVLTIVGPVVASTTTSQTVNEGQDVAPFAAVTVTDQQSLPDTVTTITLDDATKGVFTSTSLTNSGFTLASPGVYTFTGDAAATQTAIRQLMFDPTNDHVAAGLSETTTFTISVQAKQGSLNLNAPFVDGSTTVTSRSVNDSPTLNAFSDPASILENAGLQTILLSGIGAGGLETQNLTISVSSSNTAVIPTPTVNYTSANSTGSLSYTPVTNAFGSSLLTVTLQDNGGTAFGGVDTITRSFLVNVTFVNQLPTIDVIPSPAAILEDATQQTINLANISDGYANENQTVVVTASSSNTLLIPNPVVTYSNPSSTGTLTYTPVANANGTALITINVSDGLDIVTRTFSVVVTSVNDLPVMTASASLINFTEDDPATLLDGGLNIVDVDNASLAGAIVSISSNYRQGEDFLSYSSGAGISGTFNSSTGQLVLTGNASVAAYQSALRSVRFQNTSQDPSSLPRIISFSADDGFGMAQGSSYQVNVLNVNDAPTIDAIATPYQIAQNAPMQTISFSGVNVGAGEGLSQTITSITATSSNTLLTGTPTVAYTASNVNGSLSFIPQSGQFGSALITVIVQDNGGTANSGINTTYRTFQVDVLQPSEINHAPTLDDLTPNPVTLVEGSPLQTINLSGIYDGDFGTQSITVTAISSDPSVVPNPTVNYINGASTGSLSFTPSQDAFGSALITVSVRDNGGTAIGGQDTVTKSFLVNISNINDPPVVTLTASALTYSEKDSATPIDAGLQLIDIDSPLLASATVKIISGLQGSEDVLGFTNQSGITGSYNSLNGTMTLIGAASPAAYQTALQSVTYFNSSSTPNTAPRIVQVVVDDGSAQFNLSTVVTRQISVVAVKDFPLITSSGSTLAYTEGDGAKVIDQFLTGAAIDSPSISSAIITVSNNFVTGEDVLSFVNTAQITGDYNAVQGTLTLTGTTTYANYISALRTVTYTNSSNSPSTLPRTISFQIDDGNAINHSSNVVTDLISISPINSPPVVTTSGIANTYQKAHPAVAIDAAITLNDLDTTSISGATITIAVNYQAGADSLQFAPASGINTTGFDAVNGRLVLTGVAPLSTYIGALQSVLFFNNAVSPSQLNRTITFQIDDGQTNPPGSNLSNVASQTLLVSSINTAPDLGISTVTPLSYVEASGAIPVDSAIQVDDLDSPNLVGATISITSGYVSSEDALVFVNQNGITGQFDSINNILVLTGTASLANYQTALRSVSFINNSNSPNTQTRVVSFQVSDGGNANSLSEVQSRAINVIAVNSPPVLTGYTSSITYTEKQPALTLAPAAVVNDLDTASLVGATVSISPTTYSSSGEDVLSFANQTHITGNFDSSTGVLTLTGTDSLVNYQTALRTIRYLNTSLAPHEIDRTITFTLDDGQPSNNTSQFAQTLKIVGVNDAPVITTSVSALSYTEGDGAVVIDSLIQAFDVDSNVSSATVSIGPFLTAEDVLSYSGSVPGISSSFNSTTGVLTLSGFAAASSYQTALRAVNYTNTSTDPDPVTRTISVRANDGQLVNNLSAIATRAISVTNVNASPVVSPSVASGQYSENQSPQTIDNQLILSDADNASLTGATITITGNYSSSEDVLSFTNLGNGITGAFNSSTGTLTLTGTASVANYQATLRTVAYSNTSEDPNTAQRSITMIVSDGQRSTPTSTPVLWQFSVFKVNDAPVLNNSVTPSLDAVDTDVSGNTGNLVSELLARGFNGVTFTDVDRSDSRGIAVTNVDNSSGQWQYSLDGSNWQSFGSPSATAARLLASDALTRVRFVPTGGVAGTFTNGLTYRAWDQSNLLANGSTANASSTGGITPYSAQTISAGVSVSPFVRQGTTLFVNGTGLNDTFSVIFTSLSQFTVTMIPGNVVANTVTRTYALPSVVRVIISGNAGSDTITVTGNANSDSVTVLPASLTFVGTGYRVDASSVENVNLNGGSNDVVQLFGATSGTDTFTYSPTSATMIQSGVYSDTATGFGFVYGFNNSGASDVASLKGGSTGVDSLVSVPAYSILSGPGFFGQSIGFTHVTADSGNPANSSTGPNNTDIAIIYGDAGSDTYNVQMNLATLSNSGFDYTVRNFGQVTAFSNGGSDVGTINGATTANSLVSGSNFALVTSTGYLARANDFRSVTINGGAGYDSAAMYDSSGNDTFVSNVTNSTLSGTGYSVRANSFELVVVIASLGTDVATLNGSSSNDTYFRQSNWASINSPGAAVQVFGFDQVTANGNGGIDAAYIDDSLGSDFLFVSGSQAQLTIPGQVFTVNGFKNVFVRSINGGVDKQRIQAFDFALQMTGPWLNG